MGGVGGVCAANVGAESCKCSALACYLTIGAGAGVGCLCGACGLCCFAASRRRHIWDYVAENPLLPGCSRLFQQSRQHERPSSGPRSTPPGPPSHPQDPTTVDPVPANNSTTESKGDSGEDDDAGTQNHSGSVRPFGTDDHHVAVPTAEPHSSLGPKLMLPDKSSKSQFMNRESEGSPSNNIEIPYHLKIDFRQLSSNCCISAVSGG